MRAILIILISLFLIGCGQELPAQPQTIVAFGDSLTQGYGLADENDAYPAQLQRMLHAQGYTHYTVINEGVSGDTSAGLVQRLPDVLSHNPDMVILTIGANDIKKGAGVDGLEKNLDRLIVTLQENDVVVILGGMQPLGKLGAFVDSPLTNIYSSAADRHNIELIPFFLRGVAGKGQYNNADGVHPNKAGYEIIVKENVWPALEEHLE